MYELTVKQKLNNYYYFCIFCSILSIILGAFYYFPGPNGYHISYQPNDLIAQIYMFVSLYKNMLLTIIPVIVLLLPTIYLSQTKRLLIQAIIFTSYLCLVILDVRVFFLRIMHITDFDIKLIIRCLTEYNMFFASNKFIIYAMLGFPAICLILFLVNKYITTSQLFGKNKKLAISFVVFTLIIISTEKIIFYTANNQRQLELLTYVQNLPYTIVKEETTKKIANTYKKITTKQKINYPLNKLLTTNVNNPPNILIIAMDAWRADCFNEKDSPNLWELAQQGTIFLNHKSSGNHTQAGLFGLFYSLPPSYFCSIINNNITPVFWDRLEQLNYQFGLFTPAGSPVPFFIKDTYSKKFSLYLQAESELAAEADLIATNRFLDWYNNLTKNDPWFAFIFYNSVHNHDFPKSFSEKYQHIVKGDKYKNVAKQYGTNTIREKYKISVQYVDSLAKKILVKLQENNEINNTLIIITADHGCEFNDNNQNYWGYGNNFTDCQLKVPFAIIGPKFNETNTINKLTTHYDLVPTLLKNFLGVNNISNDYSIGIDLLSANNDRDWSLAGSTSSYFNIFSTIVAKDLSIQWLATGKYWLVNNKNKLLKSTVVNQKYLDKAFEMMTRFIKK
jgi:membrane-anchored protein YejM (alkaline phosphatase superfamily)